jgi:two-component system, NarL family, sensor histidine kinase DevS
VEGDGSNIVLLPMATNPFGDRTVSGGLDARAHSRTCGSSSTGHNVIDAVERWRSRTAHGYGPSIPRMDRGQPVDTQSHMSKPSETGPPTPLEALEIEEYLVRALLEQVPDSLVVADEDGRIRLVNHGFEEMFGYDRAEVLGQHVEMLVPEDLRTRHSAHRLRFRAAPHRRPMGQGLELEGRRCDGSMFPVEISLSPLERDGGSLTIATIRDVTDRKVAEREVRWVQRLLDATNDAVYVFRPDDLTFLHVNAGAVRQSGYTGDELLTMGPLHLLPDFPERRLRAVLEPLADESAPPLLFETTVRRANGADVPVDIVCEWLRPDPAFDPVFVATARDVSERLATQQALVATRQRLALSEDRERIARDLHDKVIQRLFATGLGLQAAASRSDADNVRDRLRLAIDDLDQAIREIRTSIFALHEPADNGLGSLRSGVIAKVNEATRVLGFSPTIQFVGPVDTSATPGMTEALLATLQEALSNVVRHSHASSVNVEVRANDDLELRVRDDGVGFGDEPSSGEGLRNMRQRVEQLGGKLLFTGVEPSGTELSWRIPVS